MLVLKQRWLCHAENSKRDFHELWVCAKGKKIFCVSVIWLLFLSFLLLLLNGTELVPSN